jgi:hypothetical protein
MNSAVYFTVYPANGLIHGRALWNLGCALG